LCLWDDRFSAGKTRRARRKVEITFTVIVDS
jgi:hypothetical protein